MLLIVQNYLRLFAQYVSKSEKGATAIEYGLIAALISKQRRGPSAVFRTKGRVVAVRVAWGR